MLNVTSASSPSYSCSSHVLIGSHNLRIQTQLHFPDAAMCWWVSAGCADLYILRVAHLPMQSLSMRYRWQPIGRHSSGSGFLCRQSAVITTFLANQPAHWLKQTLAAARPGPTDLESDFSVHHAASDEQAKAVRLLEAWTAAPESGTSAPKPEDVEAFCSSLRGQLSSAALAEEICRALQASIISSLHTRSAFGHATGPTLVLLAAIGESSACLLGLIFCGEPRQHGL